MSLMVCLTLLLTHKYETNPKILTVQNTLPYCCLGAIMRKDFPHLDVPIRETATTPNFFDRYDALAILPSCLPSVIHSLIVLISDHKLTGTN